MTTVFYSWQSDIPATACRTLVQEALSGALEMLAQETHSLVPAIDRDVQDVPGCPDIGATIFGKIDRASALVADVTIVGTTERGRPTPNPNVLIELGYALRALGADRVVLVQNTAMGRPELLPFDLRQRHVVHFNSPVDDTDRASAVAALQAEFTVALRALVATGPRTAPEVVLGLEHKTRAQSAEIHHYELLVDVTNESPRRIDDWEIEIEFPTPLLDPEVSHGIRVADRSDLATTLLRVGRHELNKSLRSGDRHRVKVAYRVDQEIYARRAELFRRDVVARATVDGWVVASVTRSIDELQNF